MKPKVFLSAILITEIFSIFQWLSCSAFKAHFSTLDLQLRLIESIHTDSGVTIFETRFFHNKILYTLLDAFNLYLHYLNIYFLVGFISFVGVVGVGLGIYLWIQNQTKPWYSWILVILLLLSPFIEIFDLIKFGIGSKLIFLSIPFILWSLYGYYRFLQKPSKTKYAVVILLILLSIWYITAGGQNPESFCLL